MDYLSEIIVAFETQELDVIKDCLDHGISPNQLHKGKPLVYELINMYSRGPKFKQCFRLLAENGLEFEDKALLAIFLDDANELDKILTSDTNALLKKYSFDCTFTPLFECSLLHICAEYNHLASAEVLVKHGADLNVKAGLDENGFGGQTPVFHTVNQNRNRSIDMLKFLLSKKVELDITVRGLIWGKNYPWESFIPSVNPISYAMMGLLRQFQRTEQDIYEVVSLLMKERYDIDYRPPNIPNKYLNS